MILLFQFTVKLFCTAEKAQSKAEPFLLKKLIVYACVSKITKPYTTL